MAILTESQYIILQKCKLSAKRIQNYEQIYIQTWRKFLFSSPEHEVLMVSYCGQWLSVVRRRASCVVRRASSVVRQHLMFTL